MTELHVLEGSGGLVATAVGKTYRKRPVVRSVSVSVRRGEVVGLLGPNGAGKTTTFYMIVGLVRPDSGSITLDGHDITGLPMFRRARLGIGYLPQEASVFRGLTVEQNIMATLEVVETVDQYHTSSVQDRLHLRWVVADPPHLGPLPLYLGHYLSLTVVSDRIPLQQQQQ